MEKIGYMPIKKLRKMISSKEISPVEIMNETFERINSLNSRFGAYITLDQAGSLKKAKEAELEQKKKDREERKKKQAERQRPSIDD